MWLPTMQFVLLAPSIVCSPGPVTKVVMAGWLVVLLGFVGSGRVSIRREIHSIFSRRQDGGQKSLSSFIYLWVLVFAGFWTLRSDPRFHLLLIIC